MVERSYWFDKKEYETRLLRVQKRLIEKKQDAFLAFMPETVTYLTGFFTRGYTSFQFAIIPAVGTPTIICRDVEEYYIDSTCVFPGRVLWTDSDDRIAVAANAIRDCVGGKPNLGIEMAAWPLSVARYQGLKAALPDVTWNDESRLVTEMRFIKSPAEIAYQRRAAKASQAGMQAAIDTATAGTSEREMAAEICAAMIRAGSDLPGPGVMSSGERAFHLHGGYSDRVLMKIIALSRN